MNRDYYEYLSIDNTHNHYFGMQKVLFFSSYFYVLRLLTSGLGSSNIVKDDVLDSLAIVLDDSTRRY